MTESRNAQLMPCFAKALARDVPAQANTAAAPALARK
jgi:hypothetical protein